MARLDDVLLQAFDALPASVVVLDESGTIVEANDRWKRFAGPAETDRSGDYLDDLSRICDDVGAVREGVHALLNGETDSFTEICHSEAEECWLLVRGVRFEADDEPFLLVPHVDVTELREQELSVRERARRLEAALSTVVHDVRNPLNVADGYAELLAEESNSAFVDRVRTGLARIETVVDDAVLLARGDVGEPRTIDLGDTTRAVWDRLEPTDGQLHVEGTLRFEAYPDLIEHVLENLLANALQHAEDEVTIRVGPLTDPPGFYVADDGPGIPADEREHIFEPGYTTSQAGYGLGLVVVQHVVRAHGWEIELTESESGGARFEVTGVDAVL